MSRSAIGELLSSTFSTASLGIMMMILNIVILTCLLLSQVAYADSEVRPIPAVTASDNGRYHFKMIPARWHREKPLIIREAFGVCCEIDEDGNFIENWRTNG